MNSQSPSLSGYIIAFVWTVFMGVTAVAIGIGAIFPPLNLISKPLVCPSGSMTFEQESSNPLPGTTYTTTSWVCIDSRTGDSTEIGLFPMTLYSGLIYGVLLYAVGLAVFLLARRRQPSVAMANGPRAQRQSAPGGNFDYTPRPPRPAQPAQGDSVARMKRLEQLHEANMISEAEYQEKRAEILREL